MKLSQKFSKTESRFLCALSKLDDFLSNPQTRTLSWTVPGTSRNNDLKNREPTGDCFQSNPHPEVELSTLTTRSSTDSDPEETSHNCKHPVSDFVELFLGCDMLKAL